MLLLQRAFVVRVGRESPHSEPVVPDLLAAVRLDSPYALLRVGTLGHRELLVLGGLVPAVLHKLPRRHEAQRGLHVVRGVVHRELQRRLVQILRQVVRVGVGDVEAGHFRGGLRQQEVRINRLLRWLVASRIYGAFRLDHFRELVHDVTTFLLQDLVVAPRAGRILRRVGQLRIRQVRVVLRIVRTVVLLI